MDRNELQQLTKSEAVLEASSREEALSEAVRQFALPGQDLEITPVEEGRFRARVLKRDGAFLVQAAPDGMTAELVYVLPALGSGAQVTVQQVLDRLHSMGVTHGIDQDAVTQAVEQASHSGQPSFGDVVAHSTPPVDGQDAKLEFTPPEIGETLGKQDVARHLVRKGEVFGRKIPITLAQPGQTVLGNTIAGLGGQDLTPALGEEIEIEEDNSLRARISGFLLLGEQSRSNPRGVLRIEPAVYVSEGGWQATLSLYPLIPSSPPYTPSLLLALLAEQGVVEGIRSDDLQKICRYIGQQSKPISRVLVAEGRKPVRGSDGRVEYSVETRPRVGTILPDGRIDFRQRGFLKTVKTGEVVAQLIPAGAGQPGITVLGEEQPTEPGQEVTITAKQNIEVSPDGLSYRAARDGVLLTSPSHEISVVDLYEVQGDVDYSIGDLQMEGSLSISGSVQAGFRVQAKGDILVGGTLEAARLEAGASVAVSRGIVGKGKCQVRAGTQITALYAEGATLIAREGIEVVDSLLHCDVFCGTELKATQRSGRIAGGTCVVKERICAKEVGTEAGVRTHLILGLSREQYMETLELQGQIEAIRREANRPGTDARTQDRYLRLVESLQGQMSELESNFPKDFPDVRVEILGRIYPPTQITFGRHTCKVDEPLKSVAFIFDAATESVIHRPLG